MSIINIKLYGFLRKVRKYIKSRCISLWIDLIMKKRHYILEIEGLKTKFYLPYVKTDSIQRYIYKNKNYYECENLEFICHQWNNGEIGISIENNVVLDIGANIGNHTLYFLNECNAEKIYCFEPVKDTFRILIKNIAINNLSNKVYLNNVGVGSNSGKAKVSSYDMSNIGGTTIEMSDDGNIDVVAIDDLNITGDIRMVKIDVEGFEVSALNGMMKTIKKHKPYLSIEIRNRNKGMIFSLLSELGYNHILLDQEKDYADYLFYI